MREHGIDPDLENATDKFLKESARQEGAIRPNGRGYTKWAVANGLLTKKHQEKIRQTEITGLDLEVTMRPIGERHSKKEHNDSND
jgi:hypothetical protein